MNFSILRLALPVALVYLLRPFLLALLPIPTEEMVSGFLNTSTEGGQSTLEFLRLAFWTLLFYALLSSGGIVGSIRRTTTRNAETRLIRRIKGVLAEIFMFLAIFSVFFIPYLLVQINKIDYTERAEFLDENSNTMMPNVTLIIAGRAGEQQLEKYEDESGILELGTVPAPDDIEGTRKYNQAQEQKRISKEKRKIKAQLFIRQADSIKKLLGKTHIEYVPDTGFITMDVPVDMSKTIDKLGKKNKTYTKSEYETLLSYISPDERENLAFPTIWEDLPALIVESFKKSSIFILPLTALLFYLGRFQFRSAFSYRLSRLFGWVESGTFGRGGSGRFGGLLSEWGKQYNLQKYSIYLGRSLFHPKMRIGADGGKHMLTVAPTRAGKGTTVIIPNLLLWEGSAVVVDPKGEAVQATYKQRLRMGQNVIVLDPFDYLASIGVKIKTQTYNPLNEINPESLSYEDDVNAIADALVESREDEKDPYFNQMATYMIEGACAHMVTSKEDFPNPSLASLPSFYPTSREALIDLIVKMQDNERGGSLTQNTADSIMKGIRHDAFSSVETTYTAHTRWLNKKAYQKFLSTDDSFSLSELKERPTTIFLVVNNIAPNRAFLRLFLNLTVSRMLNGAFTKQPVLLLMDEFLSLGRMPILFDSLTSMAGYGLILWPIVQDLKSLEKLYGDADKFVSSARCTQYFAVQDELSKEKIMEDLGQRRLTKVISALNSANQRLEEVRTPSEIKRDTRASTARQYVVTDNLPLILERENYYTDPTLEGLYDLPKRPTY